MTRTSTFTVTVSCVQTINMLSSVPAKTYYIADPAINVSIPLYTLSPGTCPYELVYSATLDDGSPLPPPITLQGTDSASFLKLFHMDPTKTGVYKVRVKVVDPKTSVVNTSLTIDVTILCTKLISLVNNPIPASTIYTINTSVLKTTTFSLPTYLPTPNNCAIGALTYEILL